MRHGRWHSSKNACPLVFADAQFGSRSHCPRIAKLSKVLAYSLNASQMPEEPGSQKKIT